MQRRDVFRAGRRRRRSPVPARIAGADALSNADAASGIRAALERGAVGRGRACSAGPTASSAIRRCASRCPASSTRPRRCSSFTGQQKRVDELVTAMNRAAEAAVPEAKALLVAAVKSMSVGDARGIVTGGEDSVTKLLRRPRRAPRSASASCRSSGAQTEQGRPCRPASTPLPARPPSMGLVKGDDANIERYVTEQGARRALFHDRRGRKEDPAATRSAPAARILAKVFGR